jgi:FkbM family methyltransferase
MKKLLSDLYRAIPFKKQLFLLLRSAWKPPENIYRHLHFRGTFRVKIDETHSFRMRHYGYQLENEIFWEGIAGGWEKVSASIWIRLCKNAGTIIDVGANTGVYALMAQCLHPGARVIAFEPVKRVFEKLESNIALNRYPIQAVRAALSETSGTATIYDTGAEHIYSVTVGKNLCAPGKAVNPVEIPVMRLDEFIEKNAISRIDLLKIDVETHEAEVLRGFGKYLRLFRPSMLIELLNEEVAAAVEKELAGMNYYYFNIDERAGIRRVAELGKSDFFNFLVCPEEVARELQLA